MSIECPKCGDPWADFCAKEIEENGMCFMCKVKHDKIESIITNVIYEMERVYPDEMKAKSGGFKKTLKENMRRVLELHL